MSKTTISNESSFEHYIRELIDLHIVQQYREIIMLENKTIGDIVICREGNSPAIFFIEVKFHKTYERVGVGGRQGKGIQPEILKKRPKYLESNLRWLFGQSINGKTEYWIVRPETVCFYLAGGGIGKKQNNIRDALLNELPSVNEEEIVCVIKNWLFEN